MKVIFLDIDGVLNNDTTKERLWNGFTGVDKRLCKMFLDWISQRYYKVVLSSSWRSGEGYMQELRDHGLDWIDVTPRLNSEKTRGHEIQAVLDRGKITGYGILDDMNAGEFLANHRDNLVQTSPILGLRPKNLIHLDKILDRQAPP